MAEKKAGEDARRWASRTSSPAQEGQKCCKPGYVPVWGDVPHGRGSLSLTGDGHLSESGGCPPTLAAYPPAMDEQSLAAGILGLATHRMCGPVCRHTGRWALTPPFHPYPRRLLRLGGAKQGGRSFSVTLIPGVAAGFPLENMLLCVARTFLFRLPA